MPTFSIEGLSYTHFEEADSIYETATMTLRFASSVRSISYEYEGDNPFGGFQSPYAVFDVAPRQVLLDGVDVTDDLPRSFWQRDYEVAITAVDWGFPGGGSSIFLEISLPDQDEERGFLAPLAGFGLPDGVDFFQFLNELGFAFDAFEGEDQVAEGSPLGPGQPIPLNTLFGQDLTDFPGDTGTGGGDRLRGDGGDDFILGLDGRDRIIGNGGDDTLLGGDGSDTLSGGAGNDLLSGFLGSDTLFGGGGNDRLVGAFGADVLGGGAGADTFVLRSAADFDSATDLRLTDFGRGDRIEIVTYLEVTARQIVNRIAEVTADGVLISLPAPHWSDAEAPDTILIEGLDSLSGLVRRIDVVVADGGIVSAD